MKNKNEIKYELNEATEKPNKKDYFQQRDLS